MIRILLRAVPALFAALLLAAPALAGALPVNTGGTANAIKGYDPVAYFTDGVPREGVAQFSHDWNGVTWLFASAAHRDAFAADPEKYAPQFGGYCAFAVAKGHPAPADPKVWAIVDGKLYLNLSPGVQQQWNADQANLIIAARENWPAMANGTADMKSGGDANR